MKGKLRVFVAIEPPPAVRRFAAGLQDELRRRGLRLRWTATENLHLTLRFLGDVPVGECPRIAAALDAAAAGRPAFELAARGLGVFPGLRRARVVWSGFSGRVSDLAALHAALEKSLDTAGLAGDNRPFHGHLTIGRIRRSVSTRLLGAAVEALAEERSPPFTVRRVHLFKSDLRPAGAVYTRLHSAPLGGATGGDDGQDSTGQE